MLGILEVGLIKGGILGRAERWKTNLGMDSIGWNKEGRKTEGEKLERGKTEGRKTDRGTDLCPFSHPSASKAEKFGIP
jgi:hypothetical protein